MLLIVAALAALQAYIVYANVLVNKGDFSWDPAHHSLWGLMVYQDIVGGNWISFAIDTYRQIYWPFLQSWFIAAFMLVLGPTPVAARLVSLVACALTAVMLAGIARRTMPKQSVLAVAVTVGLWLSMGAFVVRYAADAFSEALAIAMTAASVWVLAAALERGGRWLFFWAGVLSMGTYFAKTGYGVVLIPAVLIPFFLAARRGELVDTRWSITAYLVGVLIPAVLWFAYPPKVLVTIDALVNQPFGPSMLSTVDCCSISTGCTNGAIRCGCLSPCWCVSRSLSLSGGAGTRSSRCCWRT
jgi:4-amino-4-deoxy-L-arabinose transferase-like glycosyltransferase